ncbi:MAG: protein-L-isoaspartate(D-aspartate) O-methyltransferase, partial [Proteobacteria bacterium]|nr:protein-L-isoaspartate(D-aspartate) O-methyltransferase [Pseudomonadota bacterium]
DEKVLEAMARIPRELFVPQDARRQAYEDSPLPIPAGQTISQPYIVAYMVEALALQGGERVLEIGAGSGYAAAVLASIAAQVYAIERIEELARYATERLAAAGISNVHVLHADGTQGWLDVAPFDAILVSAGGPRVPESLLQQLKVGGRVVAPVGKTKIAQELVRITRAHGDEYLREELADVRFVPLIGKEGWEEEGAETAGATRPRVSQTRPGVSVSIPQRIAAQGVRFGSIEEADLDPLLRRIGEARVVLIGEASHGTSEFYRMRAEITKRLIAERGFTIVAAEADWPDAAQVDNYVRHHDVPPSAWTSFARFPTWMWRNVETRAFVDWLHARNAGLSIDRRTGFFGLDLYSLYTSVQEVMRYLDDVDPSLARLARVRYGCLSPWESDPAAYGHAALTGRYRHCEEDVTAMLVDLLRKRQQYAPFDGDRIFDAEQNAALVASAEEYYRIMYYGSRASWNLRDTHMFATLKRVLGHCGPRSKAVVWAHNSHVGDASATEMSARGELNIGQLCREEFGARSYHIGFGTNDGTVAAASDWGGPLEIKHVRPAHAQSVERLFHLSEVPALYLPLREGANEALRVGLMTPRLERAIGVVYRPESELASHYFEAVLPKQFDEYVWFDRTSAVTPIDSASLAGVPDTYPFGI